MPTDQCTDPCSVAPTRTIGMVLFASFSTIRITYTSVTIFDIQGDRTITISVLKFISFTRICLSHTPYNKRNNLPLGCMIYTALPLTLKRALIIISYNRSCQKDYTDICLPIIRIHSVTILNIILILLKVI